MCIDTKAGGPRVAVGWSVGEKGGAERPCLSPYPTLGQEQIRLFQAGGAVQSPAPQLGPLTICSQRLTTPGDSIPGYDGKKPRQ